MTYAHNTWEEPSLLLNRIITQLEYVFFYNLFSSRDTVTKSPLSLSAVTLFLTNTTTN